MKPKLLNIHRMATWLLKLWLLPNCETGLAHAESTEFGLRTCQPGWPTRTSMSALCLILHHTPSQIYLSARQIPTYRSGLMGVSLCLVVFL